MSLVTPETVKKLQMALHAKAKESASYRFYSLYDKVCRRDVLEYAYRCCRAKAGASGADGQSFYDIREHGEEKWLDELTEMLRRNEYQADAIRRVYIPKPGGKQRPLGIPSVKTRVVQMGVTLVLGAIFEADLLSEQYAYRPKRSALDAVEMVHALVAAYMVQLHAEQAGNADRKKSAWRKRGLFVLVGGCVKANMRSRSNPAFFISVAYNFLFYSQM